MYKTKTWLTNLKAGAVPSQFAWTKSTQEQPQNKLQHLRRENERQAQEERRQSFVHSLRQDVELDEVTESAAVEASAGDQHIGEMAKDELENENIQSAELTAVEQIKILRPKSKI